jgi:hypothetical protein
VARVRGRLGCARVRLVCLGIGLLGAGCVSVNAHVLPGAFTPQSEANACYRRCEKVEDPFRARCLDLCPGTLRLAGKGCSELAMSDRDACYQTKDTSPAPFVVVLGVVLLGVLTFGVLAFHNGLLAH